VGSVNIISCCTATTRRLALAIVAGARVRAQTNIIRRGASADIILKICRNCPVLPKCPLVSGELSLVDYAGIILSIMVAK